MTVYSKIQANKLAPELIHGVIREIEENPPKNMDWVEKILINDQTNVYRIIIKENMDYYPQCILKYMQKTKLRSITGNLYEIEQKLTEAYETNQAKSW